MSDDYLPYRLRPVREHSRIVRQSLVPASGLRRCHVCHQGEERDAGLVLASRVLVALTAYFFVFVLDELGASVFLGPLAFVLGVLAMVKDRGGPRKLGGFLGGTCDRPSGRRPDCCLLVGDREHPLGPEEQRPLAANEATTGS